MIARIVAEPTAEPISLEEAYHHLRIDAIDSDGRADDTYIEALISAARVYCENYTGLSLALKDYEVVLTEWPSDNVISLPYPPLVSLLGVTVSDEVSDNALDEDVYRFDDTGRIATLTPATTWPVLDSTNTVRIRYRAGYGDESEAAGHVPQPIRIAMLLLLGYWYSQREAALASDRFATQEVPFGVVACLSQYRVRLGLA